MQLTKKICKICKLELDLSEFPLRKDSPDGHRNDCKKCRAKYNKVYKEQNQERISNNNKEWKNKHPGYDKEHNNKWRKEHPDYDKEHNKDWRIKHPDYDKEHSKKWQKEHPAYAKEQSKKWQKEHPTYAKEQSKKWHEEHPNYDKEHHIKYYTENREKALDYARDYRAKNKDTIKAKYSAWLKTPAGKEASTRHKQKRRALGYAPLNKKFENSEYHHLHVDLEGNPNKAIGLYIPPELHKSLPHDHSTMKGMHKMNELALNWWQQNKR